MKSPHAKLLILGDSISLGVAEVRGSEIAAKLNESYVDLLLARLPALQIFVDADVHRTTSAMKDRMESVLAMHNPDVVLVMLGGNDADMDWRRFVLSDGRVARSRMAVETYEKNLRVIVAAIHAAGARAILTDMPNHHFELRGPYISNLAGKDVTGMLERGGGQAASDSELAKYRAAVERVGTELSVPVVKYGPLLDSRPPREMVGIDGVHPSAAAHQLIAEAMLPVLLRACQPKMESGAAGAA